MASGHLFSQRFSYGVHALAYIASKPPGELTTLPELGDWLRSIWPQASETYLSSVVQRLARGRLLRSHRGIAGGYSLGRSANKISVRDVVDLLEGIRVTGCSLSLEDQCLVAGRCGIQQRLSGLEEKFLKSLASVSIRDLSEGVVVAAPRARKPS